VNARKLGVRFWKSERENEVVYVSKRLCVIASTVSIKGELADKVAYSARLYTTGEKGEEIDPETLEVKTFLVRRQPARLNQKSRRRNRLKKTGQVGYGIHNKREREVMRGSPRGNPASEKGGMGSRTPGVEMRSRRGKWTRRIWVRTVEADEGVLNEAPELWGRKIARAFVLVFR